ncbi:hypothetical protein ACFQ07_33030 [Actinomadura adrarensis]|uniref:Uncharacterized protein n=1 Tax=Actinomadura adrarensis TaxID=1819600 RepID=A0ABW3CRM8_9ACTN
MADEFQSELLVIATMGHKEKSAPETYDFTFWHAGDGPEAVQAAMQELARLRGRPLDDNEWLKFLNVHPNEVEAGKHTVLISIAKEGQRFYQTSLQIGPGSERPGPISWLPTARGRRPRRRV